MEKIVHKELFYAIDDLQDECAKLEMMIEGLITFLEEGTCSKRHKEEVRSLASKIGFDALELKDYVKPSEEDNE